ncbi:hypothetical protein FO519_008608 [Halicephalobus sp. NKZ332]|nr:hypothetical protein FO519_008608 [Halicephalobus sp. NKZ332]
MIRKKLILIEVGIFLIFIIRGIRSQLTTPGVPIQGIVPVNVTVGLMFPRNESSGSAFQNSASAVAIAVDRIYKERLLPPGSNISFVWRYEECVESTSVGYAYELLVDQQVDFLIAPPCIDGAIIAGHVATYYNIPVGLWGVTFATTLADPDMYPTILSVVPNYRDLARVTCDLMKTFNWQQFSFIYQTNEDVVVMCFDDEDQLRSFALKLFEAKMYGPDYVYLLPDTDMSKLVGLEGDPFWVDKNTPADGRDADAKVVGDRVFQLHVDMSSDVADAFTNFSEEVIARMSDWPFYCTDCNKGQGASTYAPFLYDAMYLYGIALGNTINVTGSSSDAVIRNGTFLCDQANTEFEGMTGTVVMGNDGVRDSIYSLSSYDANNKLQSFVYLQVVDDLVVKYKPYFIVAIVVAVVIVVAIIGGFGYMINMRLRDIEKQNKMWQVSFNNLVRFNPRKAAMESMRSLQSGPSTTSTKFTFDSMRSSKNFNMYSYYQEKVIGYKHATRIAMEGEDMSEYRQMRALDHDNVNRFIGLCLDGPEVLSVWRFCSRGSLRDVIQNNTLNMDAFFVFSLIRDIVEGLYFLHGSFLGYHGYLKSSYCLVDDRWQVKLSNYGLRTFRRLETRKAKDQLWTAPELIRENDHGGTKSGDIYSFAIVCSEIVNMKPVWEPSETKGNPEEIVYLVKKGGVRPLRPLIQPSVPDINPAMARKLHLIRDCWSENAHDRPKIETVRSLLKSMVVGRTTNLMDHVFNMLEQYAGSLEEEVEERTKELVEEKKKSDVLLYRMLPKQVAEKLKLGQSVEPETFDCVTCFFSDVVSFTTLASRCTPLQVVNLLNDLYTVFDGIISEYDVYKVETIGDGYLCVSGLPHRNGNEHARHIANMSLSFMRSLDRFTIPHLPGERISLRIGLHTGGCVAGVVGLSMPRYCLFGDTVNTASRMESNGKPNKIHISVETNHFLTRIIGGYVTESRGEVIIKGKGVMETFWLLTSNQPEIQKTPPMYEDFKKRT